MSEIKIGVNIDHVATLRQQRFTEYPDPLTTAILLEQVGVDSITIHLREDRRHIQDEDAKQLKKLLRVPLNFEMAATQEMIEFAKELAPKYCCIVPEKREELTTEGGLSLKDPSNLLIDGIHALSKSSRVSLFIDPDRNAIETAKQIGADAIELNTGKYADAINQDTIDQELDKIKESASYARDLGLSVHAGHGLNYINVNRIASIHAIEELNIGHAIVARAIYDGLGRAFLSMKEICYEARND
ncbi:MAG: pyridoxine 5'-phosphate synthase [Proteobacteria bacterium]|jgi:pyridoxine 5-phosphate synthase|nr:pyridoxine 5'-phosphate synthase [Pseudomonadota bacterium]